MGVASFCSSAPDVGDQYDEERRSLAQRVENASTQVTLSPFFVHELTHPSSINV